MAGKKYTVNQPLEHDKKRYSPGESISLDSKQAERLIKLGVIGDEVDIEVATVETDGGKHISPDEGTELAATVEMVEPSDREAELKALFAAQGWRPIAKIAEPLGISKPDGGWDDAIPLIIQKEQEIQKP